MFEKVNPKHPDKIADRIAGALVDIAYTKATDPRIAVEVLIGHGKCRIIAESSVELTQKEVEEEVNLISEEPVVTDFLLVPQDPHLADNQACGFRCGDNGIFRGMPVTEEQRRLCDIADELFVNFASDGKYILAGNQLIVCQSNATEEEIQDVLKNHIDLFTIINPLGPWTGGTGVDTGATNRKLGSDMGDAVTGGGLHGKDLSKADVSVNIFCHLMAQATGKPFEAHCAIGDERVAGVPFSAIVEIARDYIRRVGGFQAFAEWGLVGSYDV